MFIANKSKIVGVTNINARALSESPRAFFINFFGMYVRIKKRAV